MIAAAATLIGIASAAGAFIGSAAKRQIRPVQKSLDDLSEEYRSHLIETKQGYERLERVETNLAVVSEQLKMNTQQIGQVANVQQRLGERLAEVVGELRVVSRKLNGGK
jgi:chromosome segregation ATPase